jgi:trehalase-like protein
VTTPIQDYAIVGDGRSAALISRGGSLDWLCWPRFDSPSVFAAILDEDHGGRFSIAPRRPFRSERAYLGDTNVLRTRFFALGGELTLTDFMPVYTTVDARSHPHGGHELVRIARCERGEVELEIVFDPRPEYALLKPEIGTLGKLGLRLDAGRGRLLTLMRRWAPRARPGSGSDPARSCTSRSDTRTALRRRFRPRPRSAAPWCWRRRCASGASGRPARATRDPRATWWCAARSC